MMTIFIQHGFGSAGCSQCSMDTLRVGGGFTQAIGVSLAFSSAVLEIYPSRTVQERVFLDKVCNSRKPERPAERKHRRKYLRFPKAHHGSQTAQRIAAIRQFFRVKGVFVYKRRENFVVQFSMILS